MSGLCVSALPHAFAVTQMEELVEGRYGESELAGVLVAHMTR